MDWILCKLRLCSWGVTYWELVPSKDGDKSRRRFRHWCPSCGREWYTA
jgi:hypothetical protein